MNRTLQLAGIQVDSASLADLCRRYGVKELSVFGSAARGEMAPESDVDIMVEFETLIEALESLVGRRVDLVTRRGLKPWVRSQVLRDARVIYAA